MHSEGAHAARLGHPIEPDRFAGDLEGLVGAVEAIARELVEHRRTQQALEKSHGLLLAVIEGTPDVVFVRDLHGRYLLINSAGARMFGKRADEILGSSVDELFEPEEAARVRARDLELLRKGETRTLEERYHLRGEELQCLISTGPYRDGHGRVAGIFGVIRDVTTLRRQAEEKSALVQELEEALQARDSFLAIASHELKTPIAALRLQVENAIRAARSQHKNEPCPQWMLERLEATERQMQRLCRQVGNLLDVSQIQAGRLSLEIGPVDLVAVAKEILTRHADEVTLARCAVVLHAPSTAIGEWDRLRIEQVVTNLFTNAIKYGRGKPVEISIEENEREVRLIVRDRGIGISPDDQARLFQRFERASNAKRLPGFGLGLWIAKQIVDSHGGEIQIDSEVGKGSTFTVVLPRSRP